MFSHTHVRAVALVFIFSMPAFALPIGRPLPSDGHWRLGGVVAWENTDVIPDNGIGRDELEATMVFADASYGFTQNAEFVLRLGGSEEALSAGNRDIGSGLDWGAGVRGVMYNSWTDWRLLGDAQYFNRISRTFGAADVEVWEWQIAISSEWRFERYYPYIGASFGDVRVTSNNQSIIRDSSSEDLLGFHAGLGIEPRPEWAVYVEGQTGRTQSLAAGVHYRF